MYVNRRKHAGLLTRLNRKRIHPELEEVDLFFEKTSYPDLDDEWVWEMLGEELGDNGECGESVESPREWRFFTFGQNRADLEVACRDVFRRVGGDAGAYLRIFDAPTSSTYQRVSLP